jgi:uncharacterized ferredoxin-like protein
MLNRTLQQSIRERAKSAPCHFDRREKSFLDPSHSLGMMDRGLLLGVPFDVAQDMLCVFARVISFSSRGPKFN